MRGTSLATLSAQSGIPSGTLSYWSWRLKQEDRRVEPPGSAFVELVATTTSEEAELDGHDGALEVELRRGCVIRVAAGFDPEHLRRVVAALEE